MSDGGAAASYEFSPRGALRMWQRNATVARKTIFVSLTPRFLEAIAYLAIMGLGLGTYLTTVDGVDYVDFIAPGVAAATVMFGAIIETTYNAFVRIYVRRVVEAVITTPLSLADVVVGEYLWAATRADDLRDRLPAGDGAPSAWCTRRGRCCCRSCSPSAR